jgi:hypothetical protein
MAWGVTMRVELVRRENNTQRLIEFFTARPFQWIDARVLEQFGRQAWRTRVSEARLDFGVPIVNRLRRAGGVVRSEYAYVPQIEAAHEPAPEPGRLF